MLHPEHAKDGIITSHIAYFLKDPNFISAYRAAKETGAILSGRGDLRWRVYINIFLPNMHLRFSETLLSVEKEKTYIIKAFASI